MGKKGGLIGAIQARRQRKQLSDLFSSLSVYDAMRTQILEAARHERNILSLRAMGFSDEQVAQIQEIGFSAIASGGSYDAVWKDIVRQLAAGLSVDDLSRRYSSA